MSNRRRILQIAVLAALRPVGAQAQRVARIGILSNWSRTEPVWPPFFAELKKRGWSDGHNLVVEARFVRNKIDEYAPAAAELVATQPEVILGTSSNAIDALRKASSTIPIVMVTVGNAVEAGFVSSLARPGGNVTGVTMSTGGPGLNEKRLQMLLALRPDLRRIAVLWDPGNRGSALSFRAFQEAASGFGMQVVSLPIERREQIEPMLAIALQQSVQALLVHPTIGVDEGRLAAWAIEHRIATVGQPDSVPGGLLMAYGPDTPDQFRLAATYIDGILRGARAAELPVQQPMLYRFSLNLKTAKALRLTVPQDLLLQADELIR